MSHREAMNCREILVTAARDTLMNIAGVSTHAAKDLRPGYSLSVDLGLGSAEFAVLAECQYDLGIRLRSNGVPTPIEADELRDMMVWQVYGLTVERATGRDLDPTEIKQLIALAQAELRGEAEPSV